MKKNTEKALEEAIEQLKEREKHIHHLNLVLQAIRNVNQLITFEKDKWKLLRGVCECLTETRGYKHAWIVQLDNLKHVGGMEEAGFSTSTKSFSDRLFQGQLSPCILTALTKTEVVFIEDRSTFCGDCPLLSSYPKTTGMVIRLEHEGQLYGVLGVSLQVDFITDTEEKSLFKEVATDIAYALYNIGIEEKHKRVVEELKYSETKYRYLFDNSSIGVGLTTMKGEVLEGNRRILDILGFTQEEFKAQGLGNIYHDLSDRGKILAIISKSGFVRDFELKLKRKTGEVFDSIVNMDLLEMEGEKILLSTLQDITDRKNMEVRLKQYSVQLEEMVEQRTKELRKTHKELEIIIDHVPGLVFYKDTKNNFIRVNEVLAAGSNMTKEEMAGKSLFDMYPSDMAQAYWDDDLDVINGGKPKLHFEEVWDTSDGRKWVSTSKIPYKNEDGEIIGIVGISTDITDRKKLEELLIRKEKLAVLGQIAGGIGHELRNPLGAIKNAAFFLNMVLEKPDSDIKEGLRIIDEEVNNSERIINSLLDYARPKPINFQKTNILEVIQKSLSSITIPKNINVNNSIIDKPSPLQADSNQLTQVFINIIVNAVQSMPNGGDLLISSKCQNQDSLVVSVQDTGAGISEENMERLFEPLFTTKAKGIGLGLAISKTIVENHLGSIAVQSDLGKGTTFTVKLPLQNNEEDN